ncbi:MAG: SIMPL domain-containing protein [Deltaproteobacteria bacterium]
MTKTIMFLPLLATLGCHERVIAVSPPVPENPGLMTVTGSATLEVSPDCADLTMTLSADNTRPGAATSAVDGKEQALIAALTKQGVQPKDMKLSLVTLEPVYEPNLYPLKVNTYRAQITVTATTRDFGQISALMEAGADAGASQLSSAFRRSDLPELKKKVRDMALTAAKDKAKQTAAALGIDLGRVVAVSENAGGSMWNQTYFPQVANTMVRNDQQGGTALGGTMQPLSLDVSVGYQLTTKG